MRKRQTKLLSFPSRAKMAANKALGNRGGPGLELSLLVSHCQQTEICACSSFERAVIVPAAQLALERVARRRAAEKGGKLRGIRWRWRGGRRAAATEEAAEPAE